MVLAQELLERHSLLLVLVTDGMRDSDYRRPPHPIAWARKEGKGRVYFNAMVHWDDVWMSERFRQMLAGAAACATGAEDAEVEANLFKVAPAAAAKEARRAKMTATERWLRKATTASKLDRRWSQLSTACPIGR